MSDATEIQTLERHGPAAHAAAGAKQPLFIDRPHGRLFAIHHPPATAAPRADAVLYIHPFAEEMNQSRRMAALQSEALAGLGHGVLMLDLTGCGDSTGEFAEARMQTWRDDVVAGCNWLAAEGYRHITLWGLRLGAALAVETACAHPGICRRLVLWQPVVSGRTALTQFLRLRIAAEMSSGGGATTKSMRAELGAGETLEIAGYELAPELAGALDGVDLAGAEVPDNISVDWIEVAADAARGPSPASMRVIERWRAAGSALTVETVAGEAFWSIQETTLAPALIARTSSLFGVSRPSPE
jgi:exosortase A-associated hydrolase 2